MCLMLTVRLAEPDAARAFEICRAAAVPTYSEERRLFGFAHRPSRVVRIPGPEGGCGCSFLADSADWRSPTWDMVPSTLPRLARILRAIRQQASSGFSFEALWGSEVSTEERHVTIDDLATLTEQSKLGTKTRYVVE